MLHACIIAERISTRHLIWQYGLVQCIYVCMSVTLWNAINAYDQRPLPTPHAVHATCSIIATPLSKLAGCPNELDSGQPAQTATKELYNC